jgi:hypothetical protein
VFETPYQVGAKEAFAGACKSEGIIHGGAVDDYEKARNLGDSVSKA